MSRWLISIICLLFSLFSSFAQSNKIFQDSTYFEVLRDRLNQLEIRNSEYELYLRLITENDPQLCGLMAVQMFNFNRQYDGFSADAKIYHGLFQALRKLDVKPITMRLDDFDKQSIFGSVKKDSIVNLARNLSAVIKDSLVQVWNIKNINRLPIIIKANSQIQSIVFTPDGLMLKLLKKLGSTHFEMEIWSLNPQEMAEKICGRIKRNFSQREWEKFVGPFKYERTCPLFFDNNKD